MKLRNYRRNICLVCKKETWKLVETIIKKFSRLRWEGTINILFRRFRIKGKRPCVFERYHYENTKKYKNYPLRLIMRIINARGINYAHN